MKRNRKGSIIKQRYFRKLKNEHCRILSELGYYKNEENVHKRVAKANIPEFKYSPLEIINMAMQHNTLHSLLNKLR